MTGLSPTKAFEGSPTIRARAPSPATSTFLATTTAPGPVHLSMIGKQAIIWLSIIGTIVCTVLVIVAIVLFRFCCSKRRRRTDTRPLDNRDDYHAWNPNAPPLAREYVSSDGIDYGASLPAMLQPEPIARPRTTLLHQIQEVDAEENLDELGAPGEGVKRPENTRYYARKILGSRSSWSNGWKRFSRQRMSTIGRAL